MKYDISAVDSGEVMSRLIRHGFEPVAGGLKTSVAVLAGGGSAGWTVKVKSRSSYNIYNVQTVVIGDAGSEPVEAGSQMQAINLAESFVQDGQLSAGTFVLMLRVGDKNVFYAPV